MARKKKTPKAVTYQIEFHTPDFMPASIATNFVVQRIEDNFKVSLYELKPDIILNEEDIKKLEKRGTVRADCVGSFIIFPHNLKTFIDVLSKQLSMYEKSKEETGT